MKAHPTLERLLERVMGDAEAAARAIEAIDGGSGGTPPPPLPPTGGGGIPSNMEARIAKLEAEMVHVKDSLKKLEGLPVDLAIVKTKVEHLPSKGFILSIVGSGVGVLGTIVLLADRLKNLF